MNDINLYMTFHMLACAIFFQVNPPLKSKEEVASDALNLATDPNSTLALNLAGKDYQAAANAIYSTISLLNTGIDYVRKRCVYMRVSSVKKSTLNMA